MEEWIVGEINRPTIAGNVAESSGRVAGHFQPANRRARPPDQLIGERIWNPDELAPNRGSVRSAARFSSRDSSFWLALRHPLAKMGDAKEK